MKSSGAVALVTGAAKGIGRAFCYKLLEHGAASVKMLDICQDEGLQLQKELEEKYGVGRATFRECDVTDKEDLKKAFTETFDENAGMLNIVCNNAGIADKDWEKAVDVNLASVIHGTFLGLKLMNNGVIVNTASMGGLIPMSMAPVYCATKHGVVGFSRSMAKAAASKGVRVNCICPSFVETPLLNELMSVPEAKEAIEKLGVLTPQLVAEGLMILIEDDSKNGEVMTVTQAHGIDFHRFSSQGI